MNAAHDITRGITPAAGPQPLRPQRKFEILSRDFTQAEQAAPLRLIYGRAKVAATQITPIFGFRNEPTTTEVGK